MYINGGALQDAQYATKEQQQTKLFGMNWGGFTGLARHRENSGDKQLVGNLDELYIFPCALPAKDIAAIKDRCGTYGMLEFESYCIM